MKRSLDTNACVRFLNGRSESVRRRLIVESQAEIVVCSVVRAELYFGAVKSAWPIKAFKVYDEFLSNYATASFDDEAARAYAQIRGRLERLGTPVGPFDMQIAAIALVNNLILVTHNTKEFSRIDGLKLEDWEV